MKKRHILPGLVLVALVFGASGAVGSERPCSICAGVRSAEPTAILESLASDPKLSDDDVLFLAWDVPLDRPIGELSVAAVRKAGATPWLRAVFRVPQPIENNLDRFEAELQNLVHLVRLGGEGLFIQAVWQPEAGSIDAREHAFLIKRAAVAVTGGAPGATFIAGPLNPDPDSIRSLYLEDVAAYLDLVALGPGADLEEAIATVGKLDPGKKIVFDSLPLPDRYDATVPLVAQVAASGIAITFFDAGTSSSFDLAPLKVLAREFQGSLVFDPFSTPHGAKQSWAFVREDLGLRVVTESDPGTASIDLLFPDTQLRSPASIDLATGNVQPLYAVSRGKGGQLSLRLHEPNEVALLRFDRASIREIDAFGQEIDVAADREIPVEEILRRLQAFEDNQARLFQHYQATKSLDLRFQSAQGSFEASYMGDYFFHRDLGSDWVWNDFYAGGVKWRSQKVPKVPLIQPEKVASLPTEIQLTMDYRYRLRGTETVDRRECWAIDFQPIDPAPGRSLFRGTVWVDKEINARVRTQASQVGLEGSVLSSEFTRYYAPIDRTGARTDWVTGSFVFPVKMSGQRTLSVLSVVLPVEVETELVDILIDGDKFEFNRNLALASEATMLRDTEDGFRYLKKNKAGERIVETEFDSDRLFVVGGVFWDESVDYPLPLAGVNYLDLDVRGTGRQFDVFFAGAVLNTGYSDPNLWGSKFNAGANFNGVFFKINDRLYRDGVAVPEEDVKSWSAAGDLFVGRPLGGYFSFDLNYSLSHLDFSRSDETAVDFVLPQDTLIHSLGTSFEFNRSGYRLRIAGDINGRSNWDFWGLPGNSEYNPDQQNYVRWRAGLAKTWWLAKFRRIGVNVEHLNGSDLDRFSGYDFGLFGNAVIAGYPGGLVRAQKATGVHLTYGINFLEQIRFDARVDAVWATNQSAGYYNELLAGAGLQGTLTLPWQLLVNFDVGYAFAGPGEGGVALRVFFLRLFPGL